MSTKRSRYFFRLNLTTYALACGLSVVIGLSGDTAFSKTSSLRAQRVSEVTALATDIKKAILAQDVERILTYVDGSIGCIDSAIDFQRVRKDLYEPTSKLYKTLFGPGGMREYFQREQDQDIRVSFMVVDEEEELDWPCVRYRSSSNEDWPLLCFGYRNGKWGIENTLYEGCS